MTISRLNELREKDAEMLSQTVKEREDIKKEAENYKNEAMKWQDQYIQKSNLLDQVNS